MAAFFRRRSNQDSENPSPENEKRSWGKKALIYIALAVLALPPGVALGVFSALEAEVVPEGKAINRYIGDYVQNLLLGDNSLEAIEYLNEDNSEDDYVTAVPVYLQTEVPTEAPSATLEPTTTVVPTQTIGSRLISNVLPQLPTQTETPVPLPSITPDITPTAVPETPVQPNEEISSPIEMVLGGEFYQQEIVFQREVRLGLHQPDPEKIPAGMMIVEQNGYTFLVPEELPEEFHFLYSPESAVASLGIENVPQAERSEFIRRHTNNGHITLFIAGLDYRPEYSGNTGGFRGRTDAPMLVDINTRTGEVNLTSFGRNVFSPEVSFYTGNNRANSQLSVMSWVYERDGRTYNFDPAFSRYVIENACGCLIDGVWQFNYFAGSEFLETLFPNGVLINVPQALQDDTASLQVPLDLQPGWQILTGPQLMSYARSRYTSAEGDMARQERQRQVAMASIASIANQGREYIGNLDIAGALGLVHNTFSTAEDTLTTFENRRINLDNGDRDPAEEGYFRTLGLSPTTFLGHIESATTQLTEPARAAQLTRFFLSPTGQDWLNGFQSGGIFTTYQITPQHTAPTWNSPQQYWAMSRGVILNQLGLPPDPVPPVDPDQELIAPTPQVTNNAALNPDFITATETPQELSFSTDISPWDWIRSADGPFSEFSLTNTQVDVILDYVQTFGALKPNTDLSDRQSQFNSALMLIRLGFTDPEERTWFTQQVYNQQYSSQSNFFQDWDAFTSASQNDPVLQSLLEPETTITSDILDTVHESFSVFLKTNQ